MIVPLPSFDQLRRLTTPGGLHEHARYAGPRPEHGYCVDDVARALVVVSRELDAVSGPEYEHAGLLDTYLPFVLGAEDGAGRFRNRRSTDLRWHGRAGVRDCWGRALWGLGATAARCPATWADPARAAFARGARRRSPWSRAMAFAGLGAAEVLRVTPDDADARALLRAAAECMGGPQPGPGWPWPEPRLTYANATLPEVLLAAGQLLDEPRWIRDGLLLLEWLLAGESRDGHLSVTPVGGRGPDESRPRFDQQPIEVAALADACARAFEVTGDPSWSAAVALAGAWFLGVNDVGVAMHDPVTGGGFDGLEPHGRNDNQGAESSLALLSTWQQVHRLTLSSR